MKLWTKNKVVSLAMQFARKNMHNQNFQKLIKALEAERIKYFNRSIEKNLPKKLEHTMQITSFGGCGTTMLYRYLSSQGIDVPDSIDDWHPWKHMLTPPDNSKVQKGFRAIYVYADPLNAVLSVFRRNFQHELMRRMPDSSEDWNFNWDLSDFLKEQVDFFKLENQFLNWTSAKRKYPILLIRFETMWDYLPEFMNYLGLSENCISSFPPKKARSSSWREEYNHIQRQLLNIYGDLHDKIEKAPNFKII